ncbi:MAG TPA: universal stress protein [Polyangiaceae bacterium]|nr:universal stress protein [Polyangiaceae bacterium]
MDQHDPTSPGPSWGREPRPVLLAAIGNDEADQIVTAMALQATRLWPGAELHLVHVVDVLPVAQAAVAGAASECSYPGLEDIYRQGDDYLDRFVRSAAEALGRPVTGHLLVGAPVAEIVRLAGELRATLLVVGTRDLGRLTRFLVGSVAEALLRKAPCSVLLARAPKYAAEDRPGEVCPGCLQAEAASGGATLRCAQHALEYGRTHGHVGAAEREAP